MFTPISQDIFQNNATRGHMKGEGASSLPPKQRENEKTLPSRGSMRTTHTIACEG